MSDAISFQKHLVECHCVLPQFKHHEPTQWHQFIVFSEIDENGAVLPSFAQCNNCGVIHKVMEIGVSSILKREDLNSLPNLDDLKSNLPEKLSFILEKNKCDLVSFQEALFILTHQLWGRIIVLSRENVEGILVGKYLQIIGSSLWRVVDFKEEHDLE